MRIKEQPRCKCFQYLAQHGRVHADGTPACNIWNPIREAHGVQSVAPGPFNVYTDGDGHYAVMQDGRTEGYLRKIVEYTIACDVAKMHAIVLNRAGA